MCLDRLVLVLNASYEAVNICSARRALKLVFKGAAVVEAASALIVRTSRTDVAVPSVVRLRVYRKMPRLNRAVSRKGIILRDQHTCQYCRRRLLSAALTLDHVIPRSRGGGSTWENLVASCVVCNNRKGNRTPEEAGMPLLRSPRPVGIHAKHRLLAADQESWNPFLFV